MAERDKESKSETFLIAEAHNKPRSMSKKRLLAWNRAVAFVMGGLFAMMVVVVWQFTSDESLCPTPSSSTPPSPTQKGFDWGANVNVGGKSVPVVDWLDENLQAKNIEDNLRYIL